MKEYNDVVVLYHLGTWYKVYEDDAIIVSKLMQFKLIEDRFTKKIAVGFPDVSIEKVVDALDAYKINYILIYDDKKLHDFGEKNGYFKFLKGEIILPIEHPISKGEKEFNVTFVVKYNDEPEQRFIVGENISAEAKLVELIMKHSEGEKFMIGKDEVTLIRKEIRT